MTIRDVTETRGIREVLHFTTNKGLGGFLATSWLKSRSRLSEDEYLEHVYSPNCPTRKDADWLDYVNLSVTNINGSLFDISSGKWHVDPGLWWCILSFDPSIMTHDGVYFTTTNNMYTGVRRRIGPVGLESMFSHRIEQWSGRTVERATGLPANVPTCHQAEVLYPGQVSVNYLRCVYVTQGGDVDQVAAQCSALGVTLVQCVVDESRFRPQNG